MTNKEKILLLSKGKAVSFYHWGRQKYGHVNGFDDQYDDGILRICVTSGDGNVYLKAEEIEVYEGM